MPNVNVNPFFSFSRVKITKQYVDKEQNVVYIYVEPDRRYIPVCHRCGTKARGIHSWRSRRVRDLNIYDAKCYVDIRYRKIYCSECGIVVEEIPFIDPYRRVTKRFIQFVLTLCKHMSIKEVAECIDMDWKTIKAIHKRYLKESYTQNILGNPSIIVIDEISLKKRHTYLTIAVDWETGKVIWAGRGRKYRTLKRFFKTLSAEQRESIVAVGMDMWDPYIKAVEEYLPRDRIVYEQFHLIAAFNKVIDRVRVRKIEYRKADEVGRQVIKGSKYLLLKNKENITQREAPTLKALLELNTSITTAYILKDYLKKLYRYGFVELAEKALYSLCRLAYESGVKPIIQFANRLLRYAHGVINHCIFPIHTGHIEGINNRIKVIKRKAYGFHDIEYFCLTIKDSFANTT